MALDNEVFDRAFDAAEAKLAESDTSTEATTEDTTEAPKEDLITEKAIVEKAEEQQSQKESRTRDESGRFVKGSKSTPKEEPTQEEQISSDQVAEEGTQEASVSPIEPPPFWSAEHKAIFAKAPREVQEAFSHYDAQRNEYVNRLASEAQRGKHYEKRAAEVFEPYKLKIQAQGCRDEFEAVSRLLAWNEIFEQDPKTAISDLMRKNGLTPHDFAEDGNAQYQAENFVDPRIQEAIERAEKAEQRFEEFERKQEEQRISSQVETFKNGVDSLGQTRRQFAEMYAPQIANALERIQTTYPNVSFNEALDHAYEYVLSEARKAFGVNGTAKPIAKKPETVIANAKKAQAAASSVTGAPASGTSVSRPRAKNTDEAIERALERAGF